MLYYVSGEASAFKNTKDFPAIFDQPCPAPIIRQFLLNLDVGQS